MREITIEDQDEFIKWLKDNNMYNPYTSAETMIYAHNVFYGLKDNPEWIKVSDDLPKEDCACIVWDEYHHWQRILSFNVTHQCWDGEDGDDYYTDAVGGNITHWKPLGKRPVKE